MLVSIDPRDSSYITADSKCSSKNTHNGVEMICQTWMKSGVSSALEYLMSVCTIPF